jgi:hypothetical protein
MTVGVWVKRAAIVLLPVALGVGFVVLVRPTSLGRAMTWQRQVSPGPLSSAHSFLENNCAACHAPVKGPESARCIACHANDESLLHRQTTAFHARIGSCRECHAEHQGAGRHSTLMDHDALVRIALRPSPRPDGRGAAEAEPLRGQLLAWINQEDNAGGPTSQGHSQLTPREAALDCAACHGTKDRHFRFFGRDCAECHRTTGWTIPEYRHPSPRSTECAQCHQQPPSHCMEHFHMVSATVARQPHARVDQCFLCHQTTAWNDIKGVGWYKHH